MTHQPDQDGRQGVRVKPPADQLPPTPPPPQVTISPPTTILGALAFAFGAVVIGAAINAAAQANQPPPPRPRPRKPKALKAPKRPRRRKGT